MAQNKLTVDVVKEQWSKTYNPNGKPDWSHIFPYYHEDIVFKDSIQEIHGFTDFEAMCNRLTKRCKSLEMKLYQVIQSDNIIMMNWRMTMRFRIFPSSPMYGATVLTLGDDGRIVNQRDYYDLWGDIADNVPLYRRLYRWFMRVFFG
jgi:hypothetical protein